MFFNELPVFEKSRLQKEKSDAVGALCHAIFPLAHPLTFPSPPVGERNVSAPDSR